MTSTPIAGRSGIPPTAFYGDEATERMVPEGAKVASLPGTWTDHRSEYARDRARVRIISSARVEADHETDNAALVKLLDRLRKRRCCGAD